MVRQQQEPLPHPILAPGDMSQYSDYFDNDIIPPGIIVIPYDEGGINPYTFLNLN